MGYRPMQIESKLPDVGVTIFSVMSKLANECGAFNLSQGFPDFDVHPDLISLVEKYMRKGFNQYAPMQGDQGLRQKIADKVSELYNARVDPDTEITVTSGATEALFAAITAVVRPGDEVIVFEPAYDAYVPILTLSGGKPVYLKMKYPDYHIDWDEVEDAISDRTRLIILNTPHNPTGTVLNSEDMNCLKSITAGKNIFIVGDEVYEHIIFDNRPHASLLCDADLRRKSFVVSSFGKTYHCTGWKIGYCIAPERLTREFQRIHQFLTFASNTPIQMAYAEFLERKNLYLELGNFYQDKRDVFLALIQSSRFEALPCHGTYFQMLDYSAITDENDIEFARRITTEFKVAAIPPSVFYHTGDDHRVLRFCFAKKDETLEQAAEILCKI